MQYYGESCMTTVRTINDRQDSSSDDCQSPRVRNGLVVAHHGISVEVLFECGERCMVRVKRSSGHVVGDSVTVTGELLKRLARQTELRRRDARGGIHLVAANLDVLGIVVAPLSPAGFIDRAIVAARASGLDPFVIVNKCDLGTTTDLVASLNKTYAGSVPIFPLSATMRTGLTPLREFLSKGVRGAFVGTTGVGKSSLLNTLCPDIALRVGELSDYKGAGRHTTTVSTLHALSDGGELVDTPGFRDFGLVNISAKDLSSHFPGFEEHGAVACRFGDCLHRSEPGCAVTALVEQGRIPSDRYQTYLELLAEVETEEIRSRTRGWRN